MPAGRRHHHHDGRYLSLGGRTRLADGSGHPIVPVFAVNDGTLTEVPGSPAPLPAGGAPAGIANI